MNIQRPMSFTTRFNAASRRPYTAVTVYDAMPSILQSGLEKPPVTVKALWDTGATESCISPRISSQLGLVKTGMATIFTGAGKIERPTFVVDIALPNRVRFNAVPVSQADIVGFDVIIGMSIILRGDFALTNFNGKCQMSFRIPPQVSIDFVDESDREFLKMLRKNPNRDCGCGSGKKIKHCHLPIIEKQIKERQ